MAIQNIGLMMTHNNVDITYEVMANNLQCFDKIWALYSSNDGTAEMPRSYKNVLDLIHYEEIFPR